MALLTEGMEVFNLGLCIVHSITREEANIGFQSKWEVNVFFLKGGFYSAHGAFDI